MMPPTHPKTRSYFQRGLFDGLTTFRELEGRISGLATKGERGGAFEVFAEAYLATVAVEKAKHVWPGASASGSGRSWRISWEQFDEPTLENYVAEVSIYLIGDQGQSCWSSAPAFWLWEAEQRVQVALDEKEPKASEYRNFCRELWLLIVADRSWLSCKFFPGQNFAKATFSSSFDRAFLFDEASSLVYELRIKR